MAVAKSVRADSDIRHPAFLGHYLDESGPKHSVNDLGPLELGENESLADLVQIPLSINDRQHLPLAGEQVDERFGTVTERSEPGDDARFGNLVGHARPFVDAARAFHEESFGAYTKDDVLSDMAPVLFSKRDKTFRL